MKVKGTEFKVYRLGWVDYEGSVEYYVIKDVSLRTFKQDVADAIVEAFVRRGKKGMLYVFHKSGRRKDGTYGDLPEYEGPAESTNLWVNEVFPLYDFTTPNVIDVLKEKGYIVLEEDGDFVVQYGLSVLGVSTEFGDRGFNTPEMQMVRRRAKARRKEIKVRRYISTPEEKAFYKKYHREQLARLKEEKR